MTSAEDSRPQALLRSIVSIISPAVERLVVVAVAVAVLAVAVEALEKIAVCLILSNKDNLDLTFVATSSHGRK
jgi:hypothetical protein